MTREEAIETLKANYPDACYGQLREAVGMAIEALKAQIDKDTNVPSNDTISRQAAIELIDAVFPVDPMKSEYAQGIACGAALAKTYIEQLPSAQPEPNYDEWCTDCKEYDKERHCCPRWNRVIRETLKDAQPEIIRCKDCKFYTPLNRETKTGICRLLMHQNFGDDWYCAGAERRTDG